MDAAVFKTQSRAGDEVARYARHDGLAGVRLSCDACGDVAIPVTSSVVSSISPVWRPLPTVMPSGHSVRDRRGTAYCPGRAIERREKPVAQILHFVPPKPSEKLAHRTVVTHWMPQ